MRMTTVTMPLYQQRLHHHVDNGRHHHAPAVVDCRQVRLYMNEQNK
jgi:hypothetical protein